MKTSRERKEGRRRAYAPMIAVFAAVLAFASVLYAAAAGSNPFLQGYCVRDGQLIVHCASLADMGETFGQQDFAVTISGRECPVLDVSTVKEAGEEVTFYCLVDVSRSMRREQMEAAQEVLSAICQGMGEQDNMVIGALGTSLEVSGFLTDREAIRAEIEALAAESDYTAIYDAVIESISALQSNKECLRKKCLVIISDGDDETVIGKTRSEALRTIEDSRIPVYTVAVLRQSPTEEQRESAKNLGAFARQSAGGRDYVPDVSAYNPEETGRFISEDVHGGLILTLDSSLADLSKDEALLSVRLETDNAVYGDDMYVYTADLPVLPGGQEEPSRDLQEEESGSSSETEESSSDPEPTEKPDPEPPDVDMLTICAAAFSVLAVAVIAGVIFVRKSGKKRKAKEQQAGERQQEERRQTEQQGQGRGIRPLAEEGQGTPGLIGFQTVGVSADIWYEVKFVAIDHEEIVITLKIPEGKAVTIGRNNKADMVFNPGDRHLSSVQCRLCCKQGAMNVWDMDSRNDTFVNGVPIHDMGMATVRNGDVMRLGSYEYRVFLTRS